MRRVLNDVIFLNSLLWESPVPSPGNQLARGLSASHRVLYVEPALNVLRVGLRTSVQPVDEGMWCQSRWRLPLHFSKDTRVERLLVTLNASTAAHQIGRGASQLGMSRPVLINALVPGVSPTLCQRLQPSATVYLATDPLEGCNEPGSYADLEDRWVEASDCVICMSGESLADRFRGRARRVEFLPNAADVSLFSRAGELPEPPEMRHLSRPRAAFAGTLDGRVDVEALSSVARRMPVVVLGQAVDAQTMAAIERDPNLCYVGVRRQHEVPAYLGASDVLLMAYADVPATRVLTWPQKLYEYLATGRPVVTSRLPSFASLDGLVSLASSAEFGDAAASAAARPSDGLEQRLAAAAANSWAHRIEQLEVILADLVTT